MFQEVYKFEKNKTSKVKFIHWLDYFLNIIEILIILVVVLGTDYFNQAACLFA